jgi:hypothetical protein
MGWVRIILVLVLIGIGIYALRNCDRPSLGGLNLSAPKEVMVNYQPAKFSFQVDEEYALAVLTHPYRYRDEFDELVRDINLALLDHVGRRMGLPDSLQYAFVSAYEQHHGYLKDLYFKDYVALVDTSASVYQSWYESYNTRAIEQFKEVAYKYTCFLMSQVTSSVLQTTEGKLLALGEDVESPCGIALKEGLQPMLARLDERAAIADFTASRGLLQEKVESVIMELATLEVRDKKGLSKQLQTRIWGFTVSTTDIEVTAISILKVGFDLNDYFDFALDESSRQVTITLPPPKILSHEVYPKLDKLDVGWLRELSDEDLNKAFNVLRAEFRREALADGVLERAKANAEKQVQTLFGPLLQSMNGRFTLRIAFREPAARAEYPTLDG